MNKRTRSKKFAKRQGRKKAARIPLSNGGYDTMRLAGRKVAS